MSQQLTRQELQERLARIEDQLDDHATRLDLASKKRDAIEGEQWDLADDLAALEQTNNSLRDRIDTLEDNLERVTRERSLLARRLTAVEEACDLDVAAGEESTPRALDLLTKIGPDAVAVDDGPTLQRAYILARHRGSWGEVVTNQRYGQHLVLASREHELKTHLEAVRNERLAWNQVYRALGLLADLGGESVTLDDDYGRDGSWGKALVDQRGGPS
jgi:hypothetical protein